MLRLLSLCFLLLLFSSPAFSADAAPDTLGFELPNNGWFTGWSGGPRETQFVDSDVVHGGRHAARMERTSSSPSKFSTATTSIPINFTGKTIELRGWLKLKDVAGGFAGLWLREDSEERPTLQFDNMKDRNLNGTSDWTEYSIMLPLDPDADKLVFGALIAATGTLWVDDVRVLVDGKPVSEAPVRVRVETTIDKDHQFDGGSKIAIGTPSKQQIANLALLGKVWGFVKYHHPRIASGEVSWDYELFRVMPAVLAAKDAGVARQAIADWLDRVGAPPSCAPCAAPARDTHFVADTAWIHDHKRLGDPLAKQLEDIYRNRGTATEQHFVSFAPGVGNPRFENERSYQKPAYPDAGYRLLALFRFWNAIEYWFPYHNLIDENWDRVLEEFIPRLAAAADENEYVLTMISLVARIDDGHGFVPRAWEYRPPAGECRLPAAFRYVQNQFVVTGWVDSVRVGESGLQIGDALVSIDGKPVKSVVKTVTPYYAASNDEARMRVISYSLSNGACGPCKLEVKRDGRTIAVESTRKPASQMQPRSGDVHDIPGPVFQKLSEDVAYIKLSDVKQTDATSYIEQAAGTKCLIIDIRNYPSDFMPFALGQHLVTKSTPFACFTRGNADNPGAFTWVDPVVIEPQSPHYEGKVAVLVDDASISSSEYTAMAFRAAGATIIGSTTAGADGNVSQIPLPGGISGSFSGIGVFYPDRKPTQQLGIAPDLVVRPTIEGILAGRDEVAEAAIRHLIGKEQRIASR